MRRYAAAMTTSLLADPFRHHTWANERLLEACAALTPAQLAASAPGTYGPIINTLRHLVQADSFYLWVFNGQDYPLIHGDNQLSVAELREANTLHSAGYEELLSGTIDPDAEITERGDTSEFTTTMGVRLSQVIHHGTDHRSQVCTALTGLGIAPPDIDVWAYGDATGVNRETEVAAVEG